MFNGSYLYDFAAADTYIRLEGEATRSIHNQTALDNHLGVQETLPLIAWPSGS